MTDEEQRMTMNKLSGLEGKFTIIDVIGVLAYIIIAIALATTL